MGVSGGWGCGEGGCGGVGGLGGGGVGGGGAALLERALKREGNLLKRNRIFTIGSFLFSMFLYYNSTSMRSSSDLPGSIRLLFVFAYSLSLSVISKGLLLKYSAIDSRFCCSFNISKPLAQG